MFPDPSFASLSSLATSAHDFPYCTIINLTLLLLVYFFPTRKRTPLGKEVIWLFVYLFIFIHSFIYCCTVVPRT